MDKFYIDPHKYLGLQAKCRKVVFFDPSSSKVNISISKKKIELRNGKNGFFEYCSQVPLSISDIQVYHPSGLCSFDPYSFAPSICEKDRRDFAAGNCQDIASKFGGRVCVHQGYEGVKFCVWAPNALSVSLIGDFNQWDSGKNPMRFFDDAGVWEIFIPGLKVGEKYKYCIGTKQGNKLIKSDPFAYKFELRPKTASIVENIDDYKWSDTDWVAKRKLNLNAPINIYKIHLASWLYTEKGFYNYKELAPKIYKYISKLGFTHIELLPSTEHPLDESWGYQVSGYYAVTSRHGSIKDFQWFINYFHQHNIGVIFDFVPGHFPRDSTFLSKFDGTDLFESAEPHLGYHPKWDTCIFDYRKPQVVNFLIGSALFFINQMHFDGIRVDAVSSMLYHNFERKDHQWKPNKYGGCENIEGWEFIKKLNKEISGKDRGVLKIAEEAIDSDKITCNSGLGFDLRWNLGWSFDTLKFFSTPFEKRSEALNILIHEMTYFYKNKNILILSHDDVSPKKKSLFSRMPGSLKERFSNLKLLMSYMYTHPGKKLLFMGCDFGQSSEWDCKNNLPWNELEQNENKCLNQCIKDLCFLYKNEPALYEWEMEEDGFKWVIKDRTDPPVLSFLRIGSANAKLICIHNFSLKRLNEYHIPISCCPVEIFNSDKLTYGGAGLENREIEVDGRGFNISIAPLSTIVLKI